MIQHNKPTVCEQDKISLNRVLDSNWLSAGKEVSNFESNFAAQFEMSREHAVAVSSGSAALFLSLLAMSAKGKKVAVPTYSCTSIENAVHLSGALPMYVDTCKTHFNLDQSLAKEADIIIHPHMFGYPSIIDQSLKHKTIEDCAQSIGSRVNGKLVGLQGELGVFSFYATKMLTSSGQGGMVISSNRDYINFIRDYIEFDQKSDGKNRFNLSMTDIQAAMGSSQLKKLHDYFIPKREEIFQQYCSTGKYFYDDDDKRVKPVRFRALLKVSSPSASIDFLYKKGINTILPITEKELLGSASNSFQNARDHISSWVSIPCYPSLTNPEIKAIIESLNKMEYI